jgi:hypothetical protein
VKYVKKGVQGARSSGNSHFKNAHILVSPNFCGQILLYGYSITFRQHIVGQNHDDEYPPFLGGN